MPNKLTDAQAAHQQRVQRFEEARRSAEAALARSEGASQRLSSGTLTDAERAEQTRIFDAAFSDWERLSRLEQAALTEIDNGRRAEELSGAPVYTRPMDATGVVTAEGLASAVAEGTRDPGELPILRGRARALLNRIMRPADLVRGGVRFRDLSEEDRQFLTAPRPETLMSPYVDTDGAMITAEEIRNEVIGHVRDLRSIRGRARVIPTNAASVTFPSRKIDATLVKKRAGESITPVALSSILGKVRFTPSGRDAIIKVPTELLEDATFDVPSWIASEIRENEMEVDEQSFISGDGNGGPLGILMAMARLTAAGYAGLSKDHSGSGAAFTADDVKLLPYEIRAVLRQGATWTTNKKWLQQVAIMRTEEGGAGTGQYLFQPGLREGEPAMLVGFPVIESEFFPDNITAGSDGDPLVLFGNWAHYWIVERKSLDLRVLNELYAETNEIGYKFQRRIDAAPVRPDAFVFMAHK